MLGDGCLYHRGRTAYYQENHSLKQKSYLLHKSGIWGLDWYHKPIYYYDNRIGSKHYPRVRFCSIHSPILLPYREMFYSNRKGKKRFDLLDPNDVGAEALAWWWGDDGSLDHKAYCVLSIDTQYPSSYGVQIKILENLGFHPRLYKHPTIQFGGKLVLDKYDTVEFIAMVKSYLPQCMSYKLDYREPSRRNLPPTNWSWIEQQRLCGKGWNEIGVLMGEKGVNIRQRFYTHRKRIQCGDSQIIL